MQGLLAEHQEHPERKRPAPALLTPEKVLANLRRLRLRSGVRVHDVQDLTRQQRDGKLTVAEFRSLLHEVVCSDHLRPFEMMKDTGFVGFEWHGDQSISHWKSYTTLQCLNYILPLLLLLLFF